MTGSSFPTEEHSKKMSQENKEKHCILASDHGGFALKEQLKKHLEGRGYRCRDLGVYDAAPCDYPDRAEEACKLFLESSRYEFGLLVCGTGIGISMAANKIHGIRCALPQNRFAAAMAKKHNSANFIAFGGRVEYPESPVSILDAYLEEEFEGGRHQNRVNKIMELEKD